MPTRLIVLTLCSIFAIMAGAVLAVFGLARGPAFLATIGIVLAVIGFILFLVEFIRTLRHK